MTKHLKNLYEDLIEQMMMEEVAGLDKDILETLQNVSIEKQRMAILSILDKDRRLFMDIKKIVEKTPISASEHIKDVVQMLRKYVEVGDVEKKKFGEVFTKYSTIQDMFSLLDESTWSNPNLKILDCCAGVGNFPVVLIEKFMDGLKTWEPDEEKRYKHIVEEMLYVGELQPKNLFLYLVAVDSADEYAMNVYCGSFLDEGFDKHVKEVWGVERFDLITMNSPYQLPIEGNNRMKPLYNEFIEKTIKISDKVLSIHPSRWMTGGMGLDNFRDMMLNRTDIKEIVHLDDASQIFNNVEIKGGVQYFLIDKDYNGLCKFNGVECSLNEFDIFVDPKFRSLINKTKNYPKLSEICKSKSYWMNFNDNTLDTIKTLDSFECYVSQAKGLKKFIKNSQIVKSSIKNIGKFKVFTPYATGSVGNLGHFGNKIIGYPNQVCSNTYMTFLVSSKKEAENLVTYMNTKFCNFMLSLRKNTQNMKPDTCKWIPLIDLSKSWTDEELYKEFNLTQEEIEIIESSIK